MGLGKSGPIQLKARQSHVFCNLCSCVQMFGVFFLDKDASLLASELHPRTKGSLHHFRFMQKQIFV